MSSILRALKKLERDSPPGGEVSSLPEGLDTKKAVNKRAKGLWLTHRVYTIGFVAIVLIVLASVFLSQRDLFMTKKRAAPPPRMPLKKEAEKGSAPVLEKKVTAATRNDGDRLTPGLSRPKGERPLAAKHGASSQKGYPVPVPSGERRTGTKGPQAEEATLAEEKAAANLEHPRPVAEKELDTSELKLEAIIWSNRAESRFAVINGQIVRTGGSIEGISVKEIARNHVALESGGRTGKLRFREE